ncbi:uncharacterized protein LOC112081500 [Eutrema salsugineum]|uniref:uncharacterized protein LOC112081500 n=1 Tax=Eutrema salsugineum TaxID=72664 RepID=UPI000CED5739|nr:uncharacterized protein LOC112081500 [Eutrema salsugineum]
MSYCLAKFKLEQDRPLGFSQQFHQPPSTKALGIEKVGAGTRIILFLLVMDGLLNEALQSMSLDDDKPIDLPDDEDYSAVQVNAKSLISRLLNPECKNMARMLKTMPRIWKVYDRVRGIALSKESIQFIFESETDMETVMKDGIWSFDDWSMIMERWVENSPLKFLKMAPIWIRIRKIPLNFCTLKTIDAVADRVGQVKEILFDPEKTRFQEFVRVLVVIDVEQPLRDTKTINLSRAAGSAVVDIEYEKIRKKCFHCFRLTHEKQKCPLFLSQKKRPERVENQRIETRINSDTPGHKTQQHHTDLVDKIMPMLAPSIPPGFEPRPNMVVPEVFEEMRLYMNCLDPAEKAIREHRMRVALDDLSKNPVAQRSILRFEPPPRISAELDKGIGKVFDYRNVEMAQAEERMGKRQSESLVSQSEAVEKGKPNPSLEPVNAVGLEVENITLWVKWAQSKGSIQQVRS